MLEPRAGAPADLIWGVDVLGAAFAGAFGILRTKTFAVTALAATLIALVLANHLSALHLRYNRAIVSREFAGALANCAGIVSIAALRRAAGAVRKEDRLTQDEVAASLVLALLVWIAEAYLAIFAAEAFLVSRNREISGFLSLVALAGSVVLGFIVPAYLVGSLPGANPFSTAWTIITRRPREAFVFWFEVMIPLALPVRLLPYPALTAAVLWTPLTIVAVPLVFAGMAVLMQAYWSARIAFYIKLRDAIAPVQEADGIT